MPVICTVLAVRGRCRALQVLRCGIKPRNTYTARSFEDTELSRAHDTVSSTWEEPVSSADLFDDGGDQCRASDSSLKT